MHALERLFHSGATWMLIASIAVLALGIALVPVVVARLPADYFVGSHSPRSRKGGPAHVLLYWARNVLGLLLVLAGVVMLVLPGQGVLTILAGISLLDFPGKRRLQLRLLRIPQIQRAIDGIRRRAGKPPLQTDAHA
jgi:hypothetical protein